MQSSKQRYVQFVQQLRRPGSLLAPGGDRSGPATGEARPASAFPRYLRLLRPQSRPLLAVVLVALLTIGIDMLWPLVSAYLVDKVILNSELEAADKLGPIAWLGGGMAGLYALGAALNWWRSFRMQTLNARLSFSLRARLLDKVLRLPLSELSNLPTGGLLSRLSSDVDATAGLLQQALVSPALASLRLVVTLGIIFALNARIAVLVLLVIPPVMALQALRAGRMRPIWRSMSQDRQAIDGRVNEGLSGVRVVRTFRRERSEQRAYTQGHHTVIRKQILATNIQRSIATIWELILPVAQLTMLCYGGYLVTLGQTTIGVVIAFQSYLWRLLEPIMALASSISGTQRGLAAMDRVFELLDQASEPPDPAGALAAPAQVQSIDLDGVGFRYGAGPEVLSDIRLHVPGGSTVALVGPSGAGKTTLTDLLTRLHAPTEGEVRLNGVPVQEYRRGEYRGLFGVVSQDIFLFDGTLRENIAYARPSASEAEVRRAAERANAHEFIEPLAKGYDSVIGERGVKLSGGQRQRLSIARALLADPQILILDEATSNLDTASERWIHRSITELLKGRRTTFIIAHRLSTVAQADQIVLLERGRIAELGSHEELMARGGRYREMVRLQESTQLTLPG